MLYLSTTALTNAAELLWLSSGNPDASSLQHFSEQWQTLHKHAPELRVMNITDDQRELNRVLSEVHLVISATPDAAEWLITRLRSGTEIRHLALSVTRSQWQRWQDQARLPAHCAAIFSDASAAQLLQLAHALQPATTELGVLLGVDSIRLLPDWQQQSQRFESVWPGLQLSVLQIRYREPVPAVLATLPAQVKLLIAADFFDVYSPANANDVMRGMLSRHISVIATPAFFIGSGALATLYVTPQSRVDQGLTLVDALLRGESTGARNPEALSLTINYQVARTLGITVDEAALRKQLSFPVQMTP